jgi:hypothetical protein
MLDAACLRTARGRSFEPPNPAASNRAWYGASLWSMQKYRSTRPPHSLSSGSPRKCCELATSGSKKERTCPLPGPETGVFGV